MDVIRVMSFNIRNAFAGTGEHAWENRRPLVIQTIRRFDPDLIGTQETRAIQADDLRREVSDYEIVGAFRDDGVREGEAASILFRRQRFELLDSGTFWLSDRPTVVGSIGWGAHYPRTCTWVKLRDGHSSRDLLMLNTHFDHASETARIESAKLLRATIARHGGDEMPTIMTGDFNDSPAAASYQTLLKHDLRDCFAVTHPTPSADDGTFHAFTGARTLPRMDWILCSGHFDVLRCEIDRAPVGPAFASDHFPVIASLALKAADHQP